MDIRFWGVRGSYPVAGPNTIRYGGNTSCVEVRLDDGTLIILDAGSGLRALGERMMASEFGEGRGQATFLISHTHWDHIMGLPFFAPAKVAGNEFVVYGRRRDKGPSLERLFSYQQSREHFDTPFEEFAARFTFREIVEGDVLAAGSATITCTLLNHPGYALGYRIAADGAALVYVADTSPFDEVLLEDSFVAGPKDATPEPNSPRRRRLAAMKQRWLALLAGADLVIYDTFFEPASFVVRPHWGHSTPLHATEACVAAGAKRLALFHHAPDNSDKTMDQLQETYRRQAAACGLEVFAAAEGLEVRLP